MSWTIVKTFTDPPSAISKIESEILPHLRLQSEDNTALVISVDEVSSDEDLGAFRYVAILYSPAHPSEIDDLGQQCAERGYRIGLIAELETEGGNVRLGSSLLRAHPMPPSAYIRNTPVRAPEGPLDKREEWFRKRSGI